MNFASVVAAFARRWSATYTIGLPAEIRARRREEIAGDLWEQQHDEEDHGRHRSSAGLAARVCSGMPADLLWRAGERKPLRRLELTNFAIDHTWDRRMRVAVRGAVLAAVAWLVPIGFGLPVLLLVTVPAAAFVIWQSARGDKTGADMKHTTVTQQRRIRFIGVVIAIVVFGLGLVINSLPSSELHDRYWYLFTAPASIGFMAGIVAVAMLLWSLLPRREGRPLDR